MPEIEVINEKPICLVEVKEKVDLISKRDQSLTEKATKTLEYINKLIKKTEKEVNEIKAKTASSGITRLKEKHIIKILDISPKDMESLKTIFATEPITLKQEDLNKILECIN